MECNVYQKTVGYRDGWANGNHVAGDTKELVTMRWDEVARWACRRDGLRRTRFLQQRQGQLCRFRGVIKGIVGFATIKWYAVIFTRFT